MALELFEKLHADGLPSGRDDFGNCHFLGCDFTSSDLSGLLFSDCHFEACNLSLATLKGTTLKDVIFRNCKLMGLSFQDCNKFLWTPTFQHCILHYAAFPGVNLKNTIFDHCELKEADFSGANLTGVVFDGCDLSGTVFSHTILTGADFRTARHYSLDPENNRIRDARFSLPEVTGLLHKYGIRIDQTG